MRFPNSQREVASVFRQFPSRVTDRAIFRARFVQHGIGVVDVNIHFAGLSQSGQLLQGAIPATDRDMTHVARTLRGTLQADQFVVAPECAVEQEAVEAGKNIFQNRS